MTIQIKSTITRIFMSPTVIPAKDLPEFKKRVDENGLINVYIKDKDREIDYENCIYFLFHPSDMNKFRLFLDSEYERTDAIIDDYDYEGGYVVVVYKLNPEFKEDFDLIRQSKYSKTSEKFQKLFPRIKKIVDRNGLHHDELSLQFRIFQKTDDLFARIEDLYNVRADESWEVWEGWCEEKETLDIEKIKQYV